MSCVQSADSSVQNVVTRRFQYRLYEEENYLQSVRCSIRKMASLKSYNIGFKWVHNKEKICIMKDFEKHTID